MTQEEETMVRLHSGVWYTPTIPTPLVNVLLPLT